MSAQEEKEITSTQPSEEVTNEVILPPTSRRLVSILVDAFLVFVTFLLLQSFVTPYIANALVKTDQVTEEYKSRLVESKLYQMVNGGPMKLTETLTEEEKKKDMSAYFQKLDDSITFFYTEFTDLEEAKIENYYKSKEDSGLFVLENEKWETKGSATFQELNQFYEKEYSVALNYFGHDNICLTLARKITLASIFEYFFSLTLPLLIFFLMFPLIFKERQSLGKKLMNLAVVSRKNGLVAKRSQYFVRFLAFYIIEILLTFFTLGIPLLVSFSMLFFSKEKNTLHDYLSATLIVDTRQKPVMHDEKELAEYQENVKKISSKK